MVELRNSEISRNEHNEILAAIENGDGERASKLTLQHITGARATALADAKKAIAMFGQAKINVPIIGLVENMAYFTPAELPENKYYLFGKEGGKKLADEYDLPFLGQVPLIQSIREGGDEGVPAMVGTDAITKDAFTKVVSLAVRQIAVRNADMPKSQTIVVE